MEIEFKRQKIKLFLSEKLFAEKFGSWRRSCSSFFDSDTITSIKYFVPLLSIFRLEMPGTGWSKTVERMLHDQGRIQILPGLDLFSALFSFSLVIRVPQIWSKNIFMASKNVIKMHN